jgi:hypothetical protein
MVLAYVLHDASAAHAHGAAAADGRWSASPDFTILAAAPLRELEGKVGAAGLASARRVGVRRRLLVSRLVRS